MKGLFLGAGASVECGMPLVWSFTSILSKNILSRLDIKLFDFHGDEAIKKRFALVFQSDTMHYEEMVKHLENWKLEAKTPKEAQIVDGLISQVTECIQLLLLELQEKCLPRMKVRFENYFGLQALLEQQGRIEIFSLNHDLILEELCAYYDLGLKDGFYANREHGYKNLGEFRLITSKELSEQKLDFYEGNEKGVNLLKLHGSFDIFAIEDKKTYLKSVGNGGFGSFVSAIRNIESESLNVCQKMQVRGVNELFVNDSSGELQFLRRSLLSGGHKFKGKFEQIAPIALFDAFKNRINNVQELVVIGYGFGDEHVNEVMLKWLSDPKNQLTISNPYCDEIPDILKAHQAQVQIVKKGLTDYLLSIDPSKDTSERKAQRELIKYLETLSPDEITGLLKRAAPL
ncbi:hypothetical protein KY888_004392 [Vibrio vulnificus]|nr:hypothetical protein [Vibrio vulnificus]EGR2784089.1 hypothetical protein [Vibrio parahaemolyticus]EHU4917263.1 hypothetical protein [Vibrio vulnificus]EJC6733388.1 hypothetical protein [Vibrio parahaemolyticus]EJC6946762.1 hypothetical protein [Vibrio parahaemolyticus]